MKSLLVSVAVVFAGIAALGIVATLIVSLHWGPMADSNGQSPLIVAAPRITVIHFTAPWCGPCREQRPRYERIREQHRRGCSFEEADADSNQDVFKANNVSRIPAYIVFVDGKEAHRTTSADELGQWLNEAEAEPRSQYEKDHHLLPGEQPANSNLR